MKKILILLLVLVMCAGALFGCTGNKNNPDESGTAAPSVQGGELQGYDFGGEKFTILTREETAYEHVGESGADSVSQAVYNRNTTVSENFNVTITTKQITGGYDSREDFVTAVRAEHLASQKAYDLISTHSVYLGWFSAEGILTDLSTLPEVDLKKSYWNQNLYNELNIDGSCYIMIGDIGHTLYEYISVMFVNTQILDDNEEMVDGGINGIYSMVDNGSWTWETMYNICADYGDGTDGKYGLLFNTHAMRAAMISQDASVYSRGEDKKLYLESAASEHLVKAVENLSAFFERSNMLYAEGWGTAETELNPIFTAGSALFYAQTLGQSSKFATDMGKGYSVLPLPKFDSFQTDYYTICRDTVTAVAVMSVAKDLTMSGVITQALCKYGAEYVTPEYYEKALMYRYFADPKCAEMLETIRNSLTIEPAPTYYETGIDSDMFSDIVRSGKKEGIAGKYETYVVQGNSQLQSFYLAIEILKG